MKQKRFLLSLVLTLFVVCAYAQEHLSFKGIPIEGSMSSFCKKLETKGLTKMGSTDNVAIFIGDFTGRQATIGVKATDNGQDVHSVIVVFDNSRDWKNLVGTYNYYKELYNRKYGKPTSCREYNPSRSNDNIILMGELTQGTVTYTSKWDVTGGTIELSIEKSDSSYGSGMVMIRYRDAINEETKIQNDLNEI